MMAASTLWANPAVASPWAKKGQDKTGSHSLEKQIGMELIHKVQAQPCGHAAEAGTQRIQHGPTEEDGEPCRRQKVRHQERGKAVGFRSLLLRLEHGHGLLHRRLLPADPAAQATVAFHAIQVRGTICGPVHTGYICSSAVSRLTMIQPGMENAAPAHRKPPAGGQRPPLPGRFPHRSFWS